ncbi:MAG: histidine kinase [Treponema sp.]|jgi:two-component system sensor histidine kinase YesM|nr:histidine kinase [Treponema sp.]
MEHRFSLHRLQAQIVLIVVVSMSAMLIFHCIMIINYTAANSRQRLDYIMAVNKSAAISLNTIGENIHRMAVYISAFESFKNYYYPEKSRQNLAEFESLSFHSMIFITSHYSIIRNIALVNLNAYPTNYYLWGGGGNFEFIDLAKPYYDFSNPYDLENRFLFFKGKNYFIYITPIIKLDSAVHERQKISSCVFVCDLQAIIDTLRNHEIEEGFRFSLLDEDGHPIISNGGEQDNTKHLTRFVSEAELIGLKVVTSGKLFPVSRDDANTRFIWIFIVFSVVLLLLTAGTVIYLLRIRIALPVVRLENVMRTGNNTLPRRRFGHSNITEIDHIAAGVNKLLDESEESARTLMEDQQKLYELDIRKKEMEIYALQSQVNPHFLNNTLQCIYSIALARGVNEIAQITLSMSELFRYSMNYDEIVSVREEIEIVKHFIAITNIRFCDRFQFDFIIAPGIYDARMCRMLLQPLVENAVRHGIAKREDGGSVEIRGSMENKTIRFEVIDDGPGFGETQLNCLTRDFEENREIYKGKSIGLYNINRRLKLNYGDIYGLKIENKEGKTHVWINFPATF